jgi:hypothetical protein
MFRISRLRFVVLVLALALVAGACDEGEDTTGGDATTTITSSADGDDEDGSAPDTTTTTEAQQFSGDSGSSYCDLSRATYEEDVSLFEFDGTPEEVEASFEKARDLYDEFQRKVPSEIEDDFDVVVGAFDQWFERAEELDFNGSAIAEDDEFFSTFDDPALEAAGTRLEAYDRDVCGIDTG